MTERRGTPPDAEFLLPSQWEGESFDRDESADDEVPRRIGRYLVERLIGEGSFGRVYSAHDPQLDRRVAIKVPTRQLFGGGLGIESFLREARAAAGLKHAGLITVHDVQLDGVRPYIVQELIDGTNLADWAGSVRRTPREIVLLMIGVAEAVAVAHRQGFVHRDLKPGNILVDSHGQPHVADFGLAIDEASLHARQGEVSGTPAYMPPEQVRGETHRLDGRSDLWSLGVILYELLAGRRPFQGPTRRELFDEICHQDPHPLRQFNPELSRELEQICLKCLEKRASDRYDTSADFADDLRDWLDSEHAAAPSGSSRLVTSAGSSATPFSDATRGGPPVVPKGLRAFDEHDADFFLELLPGSRDRNGLPASIRFWKTRIETRDPDSTFSVGMLYGPSGCGKSSLVKAGLLPRLDARVLVVFVEATPDDTEGELLRRLRRKAPDLPAELNVVEALQWCRTAGPDDDHKILLVFDQFEQWLSSRRHESSAELILALRHCDGRRLQALVLVRDDFAMAATRFMRELDMPIVEGRNFATMDLFPKQHARKVLIQFGRAFGRLAHDPGALSRQEEDFVELVLNGLAADGTIAPIQLALLAEMVKDKPWIAATFRAVGGARGIGVNFLEETFGGRAANPIYRLHQDAARAVLAALLPPAGVDLKGHMRTAGELLEASGYRRRPRDFSELIRILDSEVRLITPAATETNAHFQLTHDYLVPSLRDWLTRHRRQTRQGRAGLILDERSAAWAACSDDRQLPTWWEFVQIRSLIAPRRWNDAQRAMMRAAGWLYAKRAAVVAAVGALIVFVLVVARGYVVEQQSATRAQGLVESLVQADPSQLSTIIQQLSPYRRWVDPALAELALVEPLAPKQQRAQLHARLALVARDDRYVDLLADQLLNSPVAYVGVFVEQLAPYRQALSDRLWAEFREPSTDPARRLRAGVALARYESSRADWMLDDTRFLAEQLVGENAEQQPKWREHLRPVELELRGDLARIFTDAAASEARRISAANALADFARDDRALLTRLLAVASPEQYAILFPLVEGAWGDDTGELLVELTRERPAANMSAADRVALGRRRAGAAIVLLRHGQSASVLDALRVEKDPESLTQFVHQSRARGVSAGELYRCLRQVDELRQGRSGTDRASDDRMLVGLLQAMGEFAMSEIPQAVRDSLVAQLEAWHGTDPSSAVHGATGWLLRQWGLDEQARRVDETPLAYDASGIREWYVVRVQEASDGPTTADIDGVRWACFTMIVFPSSSCRMGSPEHEPRRQQNEVLHEVQRSQGFAVCDRELTWSQYRLLDGGAWQRAMETRYRRQLQDDDPVFGVSWYDAIGYCRRLTELAGMDPSSQCYDDPAALSRDDEGNPQFDRLDLHRSGFRLPTEAEWEMACRSGTESAYGFGNDAGLLAKYGHYQDTPDARRHRAGQLRPNLRGLFDLHGNMFEWCHDWYGEQLSGELQIDWTGPRAGVDRVARGGGWWVTAARCRSANRDWFRPTFRGDFLGFRLVQTVEPAPLKAFDSRNRRAGSRRMAAN